MTTDAYPFEEPPKRTVPQTLRTSSAFLKSPARAAAEEIAEAARKATEEHYNTGAGWFATRDIIARHMKTLVAGLEQQRLASADHTTNCPKCGAAVDGKSAEAFRYKCDSMADQQTGAVLYTTQLCRNQFTRVADLERQLADRQTVALDRDDCHRRLHASKAKRAELEQALREKDERIKTLSYILPGDDPKRRIAELERQLAVACKVSTGDQDRHGFDWAVLSRIDDLEQQVTSLESVLASKHGGEPLALLAELDEAREENEQLRKGTPLGPIIGANTIVDQEIELKQLRSQLAAAEQRATEVEEDWRPTFLQDAPHAASADCPTYYDGCHCTAATLEHNIRRAEAAEQAMSQLRAAVTDVQPGYWLSLLSGLQRESITAGGIMPRVHAWAKAVLPPLEAALAATETKGNQ